MKAPLLLLALAATLHAAPFGAPGIQSAGGLDGAKNLQEKRKVSGNPSKRTSRIRPKLTATRISQTPEAYVGKRNLIVSARPTAIRRHQSGWIGRHAGLTVYLTRSAKDYYDQARKAGVDTVFRGEVRKDSTGRAALYVSAGLNHSK